MIVLSSYFLIIYLPFKLNNNLLLESVRSINLFQRILIAQNSKLNMMNRKRIDHINLYLANRKVSFTCFDNFSIDSQSALQVSVANNIFFNILYKFIFFFLSIH